MFVFPIVTYKENVPVAREQFGRPIRGWSGTGAAVPARDGAEAFTRASGVPEVHDFVP
jgi:hypothetical protein